MGADHILANDLPVAGDGAGDGYIRAIDRVVDMVNLAFG